MQSFFDNFGAIIGFLVLVLIFNVSFGSKGTKYFLILVLMGMLLLNYETMAAFISNTLSIDKD